MKTDLIRRYLLHLVLLWCCIGTFLLGKKHEARKWRGKQILTVEQVLTLEGKSVDDLELVCHWE
jgi:hypothetical protein